MFGLDVLLGLRVDSFQQFGTDELPHLSDVLGTANTSALEQIRQALGRSNAYTLSIHTNLDHKNVYSIGIVYKVKIYKQFVNLVLSRDTNRSESKSWSL